MTIIDDRTPNLNLALPNKDNQLVDDVDRLRSSLTAIDSEFGKKGQANGYAGLDSGGKVPSAQLPSYVDDVIEVADYASLPVTGETGKIYVTLDTERQYRWGGSAYTEISPSPGSTDAVPEGATNKYFTDERARAAQLPATASSLGVVKVGSGLAVDVDGLLSIPGSQATFDDQTLTITSNGQTSFTITGGYVPGMIDVILNGAKLNGIGNDDYTATNGTSIVMTVGVNTVDTLVLRRWASFNVANAVQKSGDTMYGPFQLAADPANPLEAATKQYVDGKIIAFSSSAENKEGTVTNKAVSPAGVREAFNASGSAPVYAARAWVNFNGNGTIAIRASGNVSSITDNGVGSYAVNFTTALPDANYAPAFSFDSDSDGVNQFSVASATRSAYTQQNLNSTTSMRVFTGANAPSGYSTIDFRAVNVAILR